MSNNRSFRKDYDFLADYNLVNNRFERGETIRVGSKFFNYVLFGSNGSSIGPFGSDHSLLSNAIRMWVPTGYDHLDEPRLSNGSGRRLESNSLSHKL